MGGEEDLCPSCYAASGRSGGEHQRFGVPVVKKQKAAKKAAKKAPAAKKQKAAAKKKPTPIIIVKNFGGKRCVVSEGPASVQEWGFWDCDPNDDSGRTPTQKHGYGNSFPWHFDMLEKAYVLQGSATLTADDTELHGDAVLISEGDMVTFPKGWRGRWEVHSFLSKRYAFFDAKGIRIDEDEDE